jgi:hypothetical protein
VSADVRLLGLGSCQWSEVGGKVFSPIDKTTEKLDSSLIFLAQKSDMILKWAIADI